MKGTLFNSIKVKKPGKNVFDLSHDVKLSCQFGQLVPTLAMEVVPGDKVKIGCQSLLRMAPMLAPVMHRADVFMHYWFVPNRILWDGWNDFITGGANTPAHPYLMIAGGPIQNNWTKLHDYMGLKEPAHVGNVGELINPFPLAAYQCVYNEFYRDQNQIAEVDFKLVDGNNTPVNGNNTQTGPLNVLRKRAWEHDYFTSALPSPQLGASVDIPLGDVRLKDNWATTSDGPYAPSWVGEDDLRETGNVAQELMTGGAFNADIAVTLGGDTTEAFAYDPAGSLETTPTTINELRSAFRIQEWLEKTIRSGKRYAESILAHFGVKPQDARLQRPEYITGSKSPIVISEVLNTTGDTGAADPLPQGNMAGHGVSVTSGNYGNYFVQEHGWIIGIMSVMPKSSYQDGLERKFIKSTYLDYYWPEFAHLGEQAIYNREVFCFDSGAGNNGVWGYNPRYSEYKFMNNRVCGDFRTTLDYWTMTRKFSSLPPLNQDFLEMDYQEVDRIFAVQDSTDALWCQVLHEIKAIRPMPVFGTPSF